MWSRPYRGSPGGGGAAYSTSSCHCSEVTAANSAALGGDGLERGPVGARGGRGVGARGGGGGAVPPTRLPCSGGTAANEGAFGGVPLEEGAGRDAGLLGDLGQG